MEISSLVMVESIGTARCGSVISRRLVCKVGEGEAVDVEHRRGKSPGVMLCSGRRIMIGKFMSPAPQKASVHISTRERFTRSEVKYIINSLGGVGERRRLVQRGWVRARFCGGCNAKLWERAPEVSEKLIARLSLGRLGGRNVRR